MQGLANDVINDVVQDQRGFLWIATADGLNRFDGALFTSYFHKQNENSLPSNNILHLALLPGYRIAVATANGLCIFNTINSECHNFHELRDKAFYSFNNFFTLVKYDKFHHLWAASRSSLYLFNDTLGLLKEWRYPQGSNKKRYSNYIMFFNYPDSIPGIYFTGQAFKYDAQNKALVYDRHLTDVLKRGASTTYVAGNVHGMWWVKQGNDTLFYMNKEGKCQYYLFPVIHNKIPLYSFLYSQNDTVLWCSNSDGYLVKFNIRSRKFDKHYFYFNSAPVIGAWVFVAGMLYGKERNLWMATRRGLYKFDTKRQSMQHFDTTFYFKNAPVKTADITAVQKARSGYWTGTYGSGLFWVDPVHHVSRHFDLGSWLRNWVWTIREHHADTLWIGTQGGLLWFNKRSNRFGLVHYPGLPASLDSFAVTTQFVDSHRDLWMGISNSRGLVRYNLDNHQIHYYNAELPLPLLNCIAEDEDGNLWMGSLAGGGLVSWNRKSGKFSLLHTMANSSFENDRIITMYTDKMGSVWFNAGKNGLEQYNIHTGKFRNYSRQDGLCSDVINSISGSGKYLWIATSNGLSRFNIITGRFKNYTTSDGFPSNYFGYVSSRDGNVYIGGSLNMEILKDTAYMTNGFAPRMYITGVEVDGKPIKSSSPGNLKLNYNQNYIRINYTGVNYTLASENKYSYKLDGVDHDWVKAGNLRVATYAGLPPGRYLFQVKARNSDNLQSENDATIAFVIAPPFWQKYWFIILAIAFIFSCIYLFYRYRLRQIMKMQHMRNNIAADLHDDLGASLSNINIQSSMALQQSVHNKPGIKKLLENIRDDAQQMSESIDDIVWSVNPHNDSLDIIMSRMRLYASEIFEAKNIRYNIAFPENMSRIKLSMVKRRDFFLIFKEGVNNIAKHSQCDCASLCVEICQHKIRMELKDDGVGFDIDQQSNRNGLVNMYRRAKNSRATLHISSSPDNGTLLVLCLKDDDN